MVTIDATTLTDGIPQSKTDLAAGENAYYKFEVKQGHSEVVISVLSSYGDEDAYVNFLTTLGDIDKASSYPSSVENADWYDNTNDGGALIQFRASLSLFVGENPKQNNCKNIKGFPTLQTLPIFIIP